jgi:hypothetical protein
MMVPGIVPIGGGLPIASKFAYPQIRANGSRIEQVVRLFAS